MPSEKDLHKGTVKWFRKEKGFGFIEVKEGEDIFFHEKEAPKDLEKGDVVEFNQITGRKGLCAIKIKKVS